MLNNVQNVEKRERLAERVKTEKWEPMEIEYMNTTEFLCGLAMVK